MKLRLSHKKSKNYLIAIIILKVSNARSYSFSDSLCPVVVKGYKIEKMSIKFCLTYNYSHFPKSFAFLKSVIKFTVV